MDGVWGAKLLAHAFAIAATSLTSRMHSGDGEVRHHSRLWPIIIQEMEKCVIILDFGRSSLCNKTERWLQREEEEELRELLGEWSVAEEAEEGCQDEEGGHFGSTDSRDDSESPPRGLGAAVATVAIRGRRYKAPNVRRSGLTYKPIRCLPSGHAVPHHRWTGLQSAVRYFPMSRSDTRRLPNLGALLGGKWLSACRPPWKCV